MIGLLASQLLYIISRFYSGSEDGLVSVTEIELSKCRSSQQQRTLDTERRKLWHKKGGIKTVLIEQYNNVSLEDLKLIKIVDTEDEVIEVLDTFYKKYNLTPNF